MGEEGAASESLSGLSGCFGTALRPADELRVEGRELLLLATLEPLPVTAPALHARKRAHRMATERATQLDAVSLAAASPAPSSSTPPSKPCTPVSSLGTRL